jgi:protein SCO1/2
MQRVRTGNANARPGSSVSYPACMRATWTLTRAAVASLLAVAIAVFAHGIGGGMTPTGKVSLTACGALLPLAYLLLRRERRLATIAVALGAAELGLHAAFALAAPGSSSLYAALLLCSHGSAVRVPTDLFLSSAHPAPPGWHLDGAAMTAAHLAATAGLAWWVRVGERLCYAFIRARVHRWLPQSWDAPIARTPTRRAPHVRRVPTTVHIPGEVGRRGPPGDSPPNPVPSFDPCRPWGAGPMEVAQMSRTVLTKRVPRGFTRVGVAAACLSLTAVLAGCGTTSANSGRKYEGAELARTIALPDVTLTDTDNKPFNLPTRSAGKLTLYYFGYTNCPDVCPTTMADLNTALGKLDADSRTKVQVVFITTDPADDTLAVLRKWLDNFNHSFIGLRSDLKTVQSTAAKFGVVAEDPTTDSGGKVTDTHGAQVIAFSPADGLAHLVWLAGTTPDQYAHDIKLLLT